MSNPSNVQTVKGPAPAAPKRYNTFIASDNIALTPKYANGELPKPITRVASSLNAVNSHKNHTEVNWAL